MRKPTRRFFPNDKMCEINDWLQLQLPNNNKNNYRPSDEMHVASIQLCFIIIIIIVCSASVCAIVFAAIDVAKR